MREAAKNECNTHIGEVLSQLLNIQTFNSSYGTPQKDEENKG